MNRITGLALATFFVVTLRLEAQTQFPDSGLEKCWEKIKNPTSGKADYWDLKEIYFLTTLNSLHQLEGDLGDAPLTAFRVVGADIYDGDYSIELISKPMILGDETIFLPGVAATIRISISPMSCVLGKPFTARPTALKGFHKYAPVKGDSAAIEVWVQKNGTVLGRGKQIITEAVPNWSMFSVPIAYESNETPDTIVIIFAASGNYDFSSIETLMKCKGQTGSALYLDNIEYEYPEGIKEFLTPEIKLSVYPNPSTEQVSIQIAKETTGTVIIYDYLSRKIGEYPIHGTQTTIAISDYATGSYLINIVENDRVITTGRFIKE